MIRAVLAIMVAGFLGACAEEGPGYWSGTVRGQGAEARLGPSDTLFVVVQRAEAPGAPPVAVQRYVGAPLPLTFRIGPDDLLRAQEPLPEGPFVVRALVRRTGVANVPLPGDREASVPPVGAGAHGLVLTLPAP